MMIVRNECAAARPDSSRIVVPELAASTGPCRGGQAVEAATADFDVGALLLDRDAEGAQTGQGGRAVGAGGIAGDMRGAVGDGAEQGVAM